jgi:hypothetical protein
MKHLPELDLEILRVIEAHRDTGRFVDFSGITEYSDDQIGYQIGLLGERGLVKAVDTRTLNEPNSWSAIRLTARGHEFLGAEATPAQSDATRDCPSSKFSGQKAA